jgi:hypothetical protein
VNGSSIALENHRANSLLGYHLKQVAAYAVVAISERSIIGDRTVLKDPGEFSIFTGLYSDLSLISRDILGEYIYRIKRGVIAYEISTQQLQIKMYRHID